MTYTHIYKTYNFTGKTVFIKTKGELYGIAELKDIAIPVKMSVQEGE